mmetsp:Transcript_25606/g.24471  ORF Transcript_25606/g.24471 Transcript_25606/m.24471 type:complete len:145 (-) Transcript_25606:144-578(-)
MNTLSQTLSVAILVIIACCGCFSNAFALKSVNYIALKGGLQNKFSSLNIQNTRTSSQLNAFPELQSLFLAEGGLGAETLSTLGDIGAIDGALDSAVVDAVNPAIGVLSRLVASPVFLLVPIGAGSAVAFLIGFFIFKYGQGNDE